MKTASDILMEALEFYAGLTRTGSFDNKDAFIYKAGKAVTEAKALAEAERKVLGHILIECEPYFNDPGRTAQEVKRLQQDSIEFNKYVDELKQLREDMGLQ